MTSNYGQNLTFFLVYFLGLKNLNVQPKPYKIKKNTFSRKFFLGNCGLIKI